jgi:hypothetical protein
MAARFRRGIEHVGVPLLAVTRQLQIRINDDRPDAHRERAFAHLITMNRRLKQRNSILLAAPEG